ncbi:hypothetical protein LshimejAT787_2300730 [Lyophyllum shimeji]|uniref:Uncharacterized protein n=1 Tax=Lyophyllum shimeji TaxID=47721 RepID=A0A9P3Q1Q7_LYOSH|nr:hypothetical protein LshimejAT787_2300730 [Lyophyllum shimeji]
MPCPLFQNNNSPHKLSASCVRQGHATYCQQHNHYAEYGAMCPTCKATAERRAKGVQAIEALRRATARRRKSLP